MEGPVEVPQRHRCPTPLSDQCAQSHTFNLHLEAEHQHQRSQDVDDVLRYRNHHRRACVLHADKPTRHHIQAQHRRRAPYTNIKVYTYESYHFCRWPHQPQRQPTQWYLKQQHACSNQQRKAQISTKNLSGPLKRRGVCCHPRRSHAQEAHEPIHHVENHRPYGNSTNHRLIADMTHDSQID